MAEQEVIQLTWQGLAALISIVLAVGLGGGIGGALILIRQARQSEELKYAIERLYLSAPPTTQEHIRQIVRLLVEGGEFADEVTDGVLEGEAQASINGRRAS